MKIFKNKKTNQLFVALSRKKLELKKKDPIAMEIDMIKLHFDDSIRKLLKAKVKIKKRK